MGDRYLYDRFGRFVGTFSDRPPSPFGCFAMLFGVAVVYAAVKTGISIVATFLHPATLFHPSNDLTSQLVGRWKDDRGGVVIEYAPNYTYSVANFKTGKTLESGTWNLDEYTILYHVTSKTAADAKVPMFHHLQQLNDKALVMDQEAFQRVGAGQVSTRLPGGG